MWRVAQPTIDARDSYLACVSGLPKKRQQRFIAALPDVIEAAGKYDALGQDGRLHQLRVGTILSDKEMKSLYGTRMRSRTGSARHVYDKLIAGALHMRCPFCGHRPAVTLDHYLPQKHFSALAVTPLNLVPCCYECNTAKRADVATAYQDLTLHPYFDNVESDQWLSAIVLEMQSPVVKFFVDAPEEWSADLRARVERQFNQMKLAPLYAAQAATELLSIRYELGLMLDQAGDIEVKRELEVRADGRAKIHINSWQTALYRALSNCEWYYSSGLRCAA